MMSLQTITKSQYIVGITLGVVAIAIAAIIVTLILSGGVKSAAEVTFLIGLMGTLVGLLTTVFKLGQVSQQINGHLEAHESLAAQNTQDQLLAALQPVIQQTVEAAVAKARAATPEGGTQHE